MIIKFYLVVNSNGSVKAVKNKPALAWNEVSIAQTLQLPNALFQKPSLEATVIIPDSAAMPQQIEADVVENAREAIEQATGLEVRITVEQNED